MDEIITYSNAKINLSLDVLYKRDDGYHEIESIMQEIDLRDKLIFKNKDKGITIRSNNPHIPLDTHNLVYKVWEKLNLYTGLDKGIDIYIEKNIPMAAGLAGGSSNAAATFKALNKLWDLKLSDGELMKLGGELGADIPFCLRGGTALARGIGEKLQSLKALRGVNILVCNPGFEISTPFGYSLVDLDDEGFKIDGLIEAIETGDLEKLAKSIKNKMEGGIIKKYPIIQRIKEEMLKSGALASIMSGSGPSVFGIFRDETTMEKARIGLLEDFPLCFACKTL